VRERNDIKNPADQVSRVSNGKFIAFRRGQLVYTPSGAPRYFETETEAWAFLAGAVERL
jgi:hypothetical protein